MMKKLLQKRIVALLALCCFSLLLLVSLDSKEERVFGELQHITQYGISQLWITSYGDDGRITKEITDKAQKEKIAKAFESLKSQGGEEDLHFGISTEDGAFAIDAFVTDKKTYAMWHMALLMEFGTTNIYYGEDGYKLHLGNATELLQAVKAAFLAAE